MVLLIDTNIVLDYLLKREPFYEDAKSVMRLCSGDDVDGVIALHSVTTIWYILRKVPDEKRRLALKSICELLQVVGTTHNEVIAALENNAFTDFEDCIQSKCAKTAKADYLVTRNITDFNLSEVPAILPKDIITIVNEK